MTPLPPIEAPLSEGSAERAFGDMLDGKCGDEDIARFLSDLSDRGETSAEIAGAARAMRERLIPIDAPSNAIDVCGTGGDGQHSLNVSTAVSLVVAACGVPVAKHGNRAASSKSGAADTLEALGLDLDAAARTAQHTLREIGICFLFAQNHHPAMGAIMPIRKKLGKRTIFNLIGPLANPAGVKRQLIGIAKPDMVQTYADALRRLGTEKSMVVSGDEGLDELSLADGNTVALVSPDAVSMKRVYCHQAGLPHAPITAIRGGDAQFNAAALRDLLQGTKSAYRDAVVFNAAGALLIAGEVESWAEGAEEAAEAIDKGLAKTLLDCWIAAAK